jgi:hypothetical protein
VTLLIVSSMLLLGGTCSALKSPISDRLFINTEAKMIVAADLRFDNEYRLNPHVLRM